MQLIWETRESSFGPITIFHGPFKDDREAGDYARKHTIGKWEIRPLYKLGEPECQD